MPPISELTTNKKKPLMVLKGLKSSSKLNCYNKRNSQLAFDEPILTTTQRVTERSISFLNKKTSSSSIEYRKKLSPKRVHPFPNYRFTPHEEWTHQLAANKRAREQKADDLVQSLQNAIITSTYDDISLPFLSKNNDFYIIDEQKVRDADDRVLDVALKKLAD